MLDWIGARLVPGWDLVTLCVCQFDVLAWVLLGFRLSTRFVGLGLVDLAWILFTFGVALNLCWIGYCLLLDWSHKGTAVLAEGKIDGGAT